MKNNKLKKLLTLQQSLLSDIALGVPLNDAFRDICLSIEELLDDKSARCSILSLKGDQLFHCAAPSLDSKYCDLINGVHIGASVGSCGTAAYRKRRVIVDNIEKSPLWIDYKELATEFGLKSCWSTPILSTQSKVLGTIAIYHSSIKSPSIAELELIDYFVHFSSIALEKGINSLEHQQLVLDLKQSNEKFIAFTKVMPDLSFVLSEDGEYIDIFGASTELLYSSQDDLIGKSVHEILPHEDAQSIMEVVKKTLETNEVQIFEYQLDVLQGRTFFEGRITPIEHYQSNDLSKRHVIWVARDITIRKKVEKEIERLAFYDPLTNLSNRRMLNERLRVCLETIKRTSKTGALLFLDLDKFKKINDLYGHSIGDGLLVEVSKRLSSVIRATDTLARVGGDEFIILLENLGEDNRLAKMESEIVAQKLQQEFQDKFEVEGVSIQITCSIGVFLIDPQNLVADEILKFADKAMYRSKKEGGDRYNFYDSNE
jgi:diguanylate cyclase (GGDEF)-like protein/PAS domain S-box-containing protein